MADWSTDRYSVKWRYAATLLTNGFSLLAGIVNAVVVPVALGPATYGNFQFLSSSFTSITGFSNLSVSTAFFTQSSRQSKSGNDLLIFCVWIVLQFFAVVALVSGVLGLGYQGWAFPGQANRSIILMAALGCSNYLALTCVRFGESKAESVVVQGVSLAAAAVEVCLTLTLYWIGRLTFTAFVAVNYAGTLLTSISVIAFFSSDGNRKRYFGRPDLAELPKSLRYFAAFCAPLVVYEAAGLVFNYFDRWLLQIADGSVQQGLFSLSFQWTSVSMIFVNSLYNIMWRETSASHAAGDVERVRRIFRKTFRMGVAVSSALAFFLMFQASNIVSLFLGEKYHGAIGIIRIMAVVPIYSAIGGIAATYFYATNEVKIYRNIAVLSMLGGVAMTYFLVSPRSFLVPGLGLGAVGVAWKNVLGNMVLAAVETYFVASLIRIPFRQLVADHFGAVSACAALGLAADRVSIALAGQMLANLLLFTLLYLGGVAVLVLRIPAITGLSDGEIGFASRKLWGALNASN